MSRAPTGPRLPAPGLKPALRVCRAAAIRFRLGAQRLLRDRSDERLVVRGHNHDASLGHRVAPPILLDVISDERAAWNQHVAVDDRPPQPGVPPDPDAGHQDRLLDLAEAVDAGVPAEG